MSIKQAQLTPLQAAHEFANKVIQRGFSFEALYEYTDLDGEPVFWRIRTKHPHSKEKWIRFMTLTAEGYQPQGPACPDGYPLYRLPSLVNPVSMPIYVVEGEPAADALVNLGFTATTSGAADSARRANWQVLAGRDIVIWPDYDDAGTRYCDTVAQILHGLGCRVQIIEADQLNLPRKGDVVDWLQAHPHATAAEIRSLPSRTYGQSAPAVESDGPEWPELKEIAAPLKPVPAFDADTLLPEVLRDWVMDEANRMGCQPDFIAVTALTSIGAVVGARCAMRPKALDNWLVVPNLWGGIVGVPAAKKSPAMSAAHNPLNRLIARANDAYHAETLAFTLEKEVFDIQEETIHARMKSAAKVKNGKGEDIHALKDEMKAHRDQATEAPTLKRYRTNDTTVEKLGELLRDNPTGMLVMRDELVGLISTWDKEGREGERSFYLEGWNGSASFDTDRIGRGAIFIKNLCLSVFGGIQPDKLTLYLEQASNAMSNDGMLQRFQMLVYPDKPDWDYRDRGPDLALLKRVYDVFDLLAEFDPLAWGAAPASEIAKFPHFCFDDAAQAVFIAWLTEMHTIRLPQEEEPMIEQHLSKYDKLFPALAMLLHLIECAATGARGPVTAKAALRAAAWCEYLEAHARRCYGLLIDGGFRSAYALVEKIKAGKLQDHFTARDIRRNRWRFLSSDDAVQAALDWLEDDGWLWSYDVGGGQGMGRRTVRYLINPKAANKGTPLAS